MLMLNPFQRDVTHPITSNDHYRGNINANVRILIYVDFVDAEFVPIHASINELLKTSSDDVLVAYRHFPQTVSHPQAFAAAQAIESAGKQGQFWKMVEHILAHQDKLSDGMLRQYARLIGVDMAKFEDHFSESGLVKRIKQDIDTGKASGVDSTPAIFINGVRHQNLSMRYIQELISSGGEVSG